MFMSLKWLEKIIKRFERDYVKIDCFLKIVYYSWENYVKSGEFNDG